MGFIRFSRETKVKNSVFTIKNDQLAAVQNVPPTAELSDRFPSTLAASVVAYFEIISGLSLLPLLAHTLGVPYVEEMFTSRGLPVALAITCVPLKILFSILLLHGIHYKKAWCLVPYLLIEMMVIFAGPFAFMFVIVAMHSVEWVTLVPFVFIFVWIEYFKWRLIYYFYDYLTIKKRSSQAFGKMVDEINSKNELPKNADEIEALFISTNTDEKCEK